MRRSAIPPERRQLDLLQPVLSLSETLGAHIPIGRLPDSQKVSNDDRLGAGLQDLIFRAFRELRGVNRRCPNNKIPAIVDAEGPGGEAISVFESGAILIYLAEKTGQFLPRQLAERVPVLEWLMFQMGGFGPMPGQVHHFVGLKDETERRYGLHRFIAETERLYGVMDRRLASHPYFAGAALSIADFAIVGWVWRHQRHRIDLARFPNVERWYRSLMARPAVLRGFAVALRADP